MGTQMKRIEDDQPFSQLKKRSSLPATIDENSKKLQSRLSLGCGKMPPSAEVMRSWDMRSLKVLVERTKFNEMHVVDSNRIVKLPLKLAKLTNGGVLEKTPESRRRRRSWKKAAQANPGKASVDRLFRTRKCYVRIPKDKLIIRLLAMQASAAPRRQAQSVEQKRSRGRPKKTPRRKSALRTAVVDTSAPNEDRLDSSPVARDPAAGLKRKTTDAADALPAKRSRKSKVQRGNEFFINIGALTRTPSPRRRVTSSISPEEVKRKPRRQATKQSTQLNLAALRDKFGIRFFKSYVKVKRLSDSSRLTATTPSSAKKKKKNGKNLSVSFLETVEIFGESSDGEEWMDYEDSGFSPKGARLKRLENGLDDEDDAVKSFSTSTPAGGAGSRSSTAAQDPTNSARRSGGILKRKEKISFSPLKEDNKDNSPRKEQLKRANEKIVRLSFEQQPADDEEREAASTQQPDTTEKETTAAAPIIAAEPEEKVECVSIEPKTSLVSINPETELTTPPSLIENDEAATLENEPRTEQREPDGKEEEESLEKNPEDTEPAEADKPADDDVASEKAAEDNKEAGESFESAIALSPNLDETGDQEHSTKKDEINLVQKALKDLEGSEHGEGDTNFQKQNIVEELTEPCLESVETPEPSATEEKEISDTSQVNTSNNSDQQFEDASELVATAILNDSVTNAESNESEAVLNDVCHLTEDRASLLSDEEEPFPQPDEPDAVDGTNDDFRSVLTHPEIERSLQSAASDLIQNSQEITVAEAAASSVTVVDEEDAFASVVAEVARFTKDVNAEIYSNDVGITGTDVMMDNVQASNSLDDIFDDDVDDDIISSLRMSSSGNIDICHEKSLPIQVIETDVMAIPNDPDIIFGKSLGTTSSILDTSMNSSTNTLPAAGHGQNSSVDTNSKLSLGRIFQSVKSYMMPPTKDKNTALKD